MNRALLAILTLGLAACSNPAGAAQLATQRVSYNEAIARSGTEQLLLNLVRLRYLHAPQFFEVTSVTTQGTIRAGVSAGVDGTLGELPGVTPLAVVTPTLGGTFEWEETPTITYEPLQGEAFAQRMVSPISAETVMQLVQVGWRIDNILACAVQRVNGLSAPIIASRDPSFGGERFLRVARLLYDLQIHQVIEVDVLRRGEDPAEVYLVFLPTDDPRLREESDEARRLLGLDPERASYRILSSDDPVAVAERSSDGASEEAGPSPGLDRIVLRGRSLLGTMMYLSHGVEVPASDGAARSLAYEDGARGEVRPPSPVPGALLTVRIDPREGTPYSMVGYRGHRFVIADEDLESKQTFLLLNVLFSLLSAPGSGGPVLTLPVGG